MACRRLGVRIPLAPPVFGSLFGFGDNPSDNDYVWASSLSSKTSSMTVAPRGSRARSHAADGLGDMGGLVPHGVADLLDGDAVAAHDRDRGVPSLVGVPAADAGAAGHLAEPPVELAGRIRVAVLVAE